MTVVHSISSDGGRDTFPLSCCDEIGAQPSWIFLRVLACAFSWSHFHENRWGGGEGGRYKGTLRHTLCGDASAIKCPSALLNRVQRTEGRMRTPCAREREGE